MGLGVRQHIMVKFDGDYVLHGNITAIESDQFTILPDKQQAPVEVAYNSVQNVHKNLSAGATIAIVVGIAAAVVILAALLTGSDTVRGSL